MVPLRTPICRAVRVATSRQNRNQTKNPDDDFKPKRPQSAALRAGVNHRLSVEGSL
jgi:hypothetical protein